MKMNLQDYIGIYNISNQNICKEIIAEINETEWQKHSYHNPITYEKTSYQDDLDINYKSEISEKYLDDIIKQSVNDYLSTVVPNQFGLQQIGDVRFNKYSIGTQMRPHHDHIHSLFDGERKGVPILTVLGLLNDDFEGGDFLMFDGKKLNLSAGDIIIFPSNFLYPHAVTTITKGTRYSFVAWGW
jgi:predicted 2-oxoglutarate/Fe(II)-dependent dioxygenase YbiX